MEAKPHAGREEQARCVKAAPRVTAMRKGGTGLSACKNPPLVSRTYAGVHGITTVGLGMLCVMWDKAN